MIGFWDLVARTEHGPLVDEKTFDMELAAKAQAMVEKYHVGFDPARVVPADDDLADRLYRAGLDLFLDMGIYCRDTGRRARFSAEEVAWALHHAPREVTYGQGLDRATMVHRRVEDPRPPFCLMTPVGTPVAEERFVPLVQSYAQEPLAQTFSSAFSETVHGRPIKSGTPQEVEAAIWNVVKLREAARAAGRPQLGIHNLVSNAERTDATLAAVHEAFGAQPNDGLCIASTAELKVDYERLKKVAFLRHSGHNKYGLYGPLMGGWAGGPEATAVVLVAYHFLGVMALEAQWHCSFPLHIFHGCNTTREMLWLVSLTTQAISRNTSLLVAMSTFTAAGPCTEMVILELVAHVLAVTVSGGHLNLAAVARNRHPERATGMEARIGAETGHLAAGTGITREQADELVQALLARYEGRVADAPLGKRFDECYDLQRVQPVQEYLDLYARIQDELRPLGLDYARL